MVLYLATWEPNYLQFQEVFSNEYSLKILAFLSQNTQKNKKTCASDIAKVLEMHISTATKYLDLLSKYNFVKKNQLANKPGKPTYYESTSDSIVINLNLTQFNQNIQASFEINSIQNPLVREKPNIQKRVIYKFNQADIIENFIVKKKTKAKRVVKQKITLSNNESAFMKYLPHPTMKSEPFLDICKKANLSDFFTIKEIEFFLEKLKKYDIIEIYDQQPI
jgi:hypothetical protein